MATRHGWTPSDANARLVEEGLRRSEFAFIDFRDSAVDRQAYVQGSTLAVWEVILVVRARNGSVAAVAKHLEWPESRVQASLNYAEAFPEEIERAASENAATDFDALKRMLSVVVKIGSGLMRKSRHGQLLLDEHISPAVLKGLARRHRSVVGHGMAEGEDGRFLGEENSACLEHAAELGLTLVTYGRGRFRPAEGLGGGGSGSWRHHFHR